MRKQMSMLRIQAAVMLALALFSCGKKDDAPAPKPPPQETVTELSAQVRDLKSRTLEQVQLGYLAPDSCWELGRLAVQISFLHQEIFLQTPSAPVKDDFKIVFYDYKQATLGFTSPLLLDVSSAVESCPSTRKDQLDSEIAEVYVPWLDFLNTPGAQIYLVNQQRPTAISIRQLLSKLATDVKDFNSRIIVQGSTLFSVEEKRNQLYQVATWSWTHYELMARTPIESLSDDSRYHFRQLTLFMNQLKNEMMLWDGTFASSQKLRNALDNIAIVTAQILDDIEPHQ